MLINDSCASFQDGFQSRGKNAKDRGLSSIQGDIVMLQQKQKTIWASIQKVKQTNSLLKKQTKSLVDTLRDEFKQKSKWKIEKIEAILATLDAKVEFVVGTCDRYVKNISEQLSQQFSAKSKEEQERQAILQSYSQISERIRVLEQKAYSYKQNQEQLRKQLEFVMQKNSGMAQDINSLTIKSSQRIQQLENALRQKVDEIRRKDTEILKREEIFRKDIETLKLQQVQQVAAVQQQQQQQQAMIYQHQVQQAIQQVPQTGVNQLSRLNIPSQPNITPISFQSPKTQQQYLQVPRGQPQTKPPKPAPVQSEPPSLSVSHASSVSNYNFNNAIQIKPDFFKAGEVSQVSEVQDQAEFKGIFLKSLRQQEAGGINVRKLKQSTDSSNSVQRVRFGKKDQSHRFDYLINNLAATQGESTQIFDGYNNDTLLSSNPSMLNHHFR